MRNVENIYRTVVHVKKKNLRVKCVSVSLGVRGNINVFRQTRVVEGLSFATLPGYTLSGGGRELKPPEGPSFLLDLPVVEDG